MTTLASQFAVLGDRLPAGWRFHLWSLPLAHIAWLASLPDEVYDLVADSPPPARPTYAAFRSVVDELGPGIGFPARQHRELFLAEHERTGFAEQDHDLAEYGQRLLARVPAQACGTGDGPGHDPSRHRSWFTLPRARKG